MSGLPYPSRRRAWGMSVLLGAFMLALALRYLVGSSGFGEPNDAVARYRLDAGLAATSIGVSLAIAGLFLQVLLRNPLASPFVLGISSGASFGYMLALYLGWRFGVSAGGFFDLGGASLFAVAGSLGTLWLVWQLGSRRGAIDPLGLVLAGVIVGSMAAAGTTALQSLVPAGLRGDFMGWMMGRIPDAPSQRVLLPVSALAAGATALGILLGPALDAAALSDDEARSVGVRLSLVRGVLFVTAGVLAAATVALAGPIGFVGLVAPHAARLLIGPRHGPLAVGSALAGAAMLLAADSARQVIDFGGGRLPVGVLTALVGGPVFLILLRRAPILHRAGDGGRE